MTDTFELQPAKPMVYVAGPIAHNPHGCVREVIPVFDELRARGLVPFLPQLSVIFDMISGRSWEEWLAYDLDVIMNCDLLVRLPGKSKGADREVKFARANNIPVITLADPIDYTPVDVFMTAWRAVYPDTAGEGDAPEPEVFDVPAICSHCGQKAKGFAMIGDRRYCLEDSDSPSCYHVAQYSNHNSVFVDEGEIL